MDLWADINLVPRFYEINHGRITIDETDILNIAKAEWRRCTGLVLPDTFLFANTVLENIRYGKLTSVSGQRKRQMPIILSSFCPRDIKRLFQNGPEISARGSDNFWLLPGPFWRIRGF
nr:hypothetical protein [Desulforapulum autotrophicum]